MATLQPLDGYVYLLDDVGGAVDGGIVELASLRAKHLDYVVVAGADEGYGPGDRVILDSADAGRRIRVDGIPCRVVEKGSIVARLD